jgi:hypothetical protein
VLVATQQPGNLSNLSNPQPSKNQAVEMQRADQPFRLSVKKSFSDFSAATAVLSRSG